MTLQLLLPLAILPFNTSASQFLFEELPSSATAFLIFCRIFTSSATASGWSKIIFSASSSSILTPLIFAAFLCSSSSPWTTPDRLPIVVLFLNLLLIVSESANSLSSANHVASVTSSMDFCMTYLVILGLSPSLTIQCPWSSRDGVRYFTLSTVTSIAPCLQFLFWSNTSWRKLGHSGFRSVQEVSVHLTYLNAHGHHSDPTWACLHVLLSWVFSHWTATSAWPSCLWIMPRCLCECNSTLKCPPFEVPHKFVSLISTDSVDVVSIQHVSKSLVVPFCKSWSQFPACLLPSFAPYLLPFLRLLFDRNHLLPTDLILHIGSFWSSVLGAPSNLPSSATLIKASYTPPGINMSWFYINFHQPPSLSSFFWERSQQVEAFFTCIEMNQHTIPLQLLQPSVREVPLTWFNHCPSSNQPLERHRDRLDAPASHPLLNQLRDIWGPTRCAFCLKFSKRCRTRTFLTSFHSTAASKGHQMCLSVSITPPGVILNCTDPPSAKVPQTWW